MVEFRVLTESESSEWNSIVKDFSEWDIYYLFNYIKSLEIHGDGSPVLFYYKSNNCRICYPMHVNDVSDCTFFKGSLERNKFWDLSSPYGYGGPLVEGRCDKLEIGNFQNYFLEYCSQNNIISQFIRFHPLYQNQIYLGSKSDTMQLKETITIHTEDRESILKNMHSKNRNMIKKAQKSGCVILHDSIDCMDDFIRIYEKTMDNLNADEYYYFRREYYDYLKNNMSNNIKLFRCEREGQIISAAIFFYNNQFMHYHLSGTLSEARQYAPTNLMIYEAAMWANEHGIKELHLGGGNLPEDSLFSFKKKMNKNGRLPFYIGRTIIDKKGYQKLLEIRASMDNDFNIDNGYYIQYRQPK